MKEKRPTISPNFNFLGQLLDFEKKIKTPQGAAAKLKSLHQPSSEAPAQRDDPEPLPRPEGPGLEPLTLPCVLAEAPEERLLAQALSGLRLPDGADENARLKRSFSLDIKSFGEPGGNSSHRTFAPHGGSDSDIYKLSGFKEQSSKPCQFSPVEEVSEQCTPEQSPDKEEAEGPEGPKPQSAAPSRSQATLRSISVEERAPGFLLGLPRSQHHLAKPGPGGALKGWHSDILLGPVTVSTSSLAGGWYLSSDSTRFYSSSILSGAGGVGLAAYSCSQGLEAVRRRGRPRTGDHGDSRRSWHEESSFEKQLKRRSCQMEFGDGMTDSRSREELGKVGSQSSFSGSMEVIEVS